MVSKFISIIFLSFFSCSIVAQKKYSSEYPPLPQSGMARNALISINTTFGVQLPAADLAKRFGSNMSVGGGVEYITLPKGWIVNADVQFLFGQSVKEDVLAPLRTPEGAILGDIGAYASVQLRERGLFMGVNAGRLFKFFDNGNRVGGLRLTVGGGFLQHKIRIQDDTNSAPQVAPPYSAGYDRLTNGFCLSQFIGYQIVSRDKTINFFVGFDFMEGFTRNRRGFNFDTRRPDTQKRIDVLYGARVGWSIPIFSNQNADEIEY